jgi:hypothetical protein
MQQPEHLSREGDGRGAERFSGCSTTWPRATC